MSKTAVIAVICYFIGLALGYWWGHYNGEKNNG